MSIRTEREGWRSEASCLGMPPGEVDRIFYPGSYSNKLTAEARAICATCPVKQDCLSFALSLRQGDDTYGIFGGTTPEERKQLRKGTIDSDTIEAYS